MTILLRILVGLIALLLLVLGLNLMFNPAAAAAGLGLTPEGSLGLNTLRGDFGGMFLASTVLLALGLVRQRAEWFLAVAVVMGLIAIGRIVGFVIDGAPTSATGAAFAVEILIVLVLLAASRKLAPASR